MIFLYVFFGLGALALLFGGVFFVAAWVWFQLVSIIRSIFGSR
jgi:hypothetical protein